MSYKRNNTVFEKKEDAFKRKICEELQKKETEARNLTIPQINSQEHPNTETRQENPYYVIIPYFVCPFSSQLDNNRM